MFFDCFSLSDIKELEKWNFSRGNNFLVLFSGCKLLPDIDELKVKWKIKYF